MRHLSSIPDFFIKDLRNIGLECTIRYNKFVVICNDIEILFFNLHYAYPIDYTGLLDVVKDAIQKEIDP